MLGWGGLFYTQRGLFAQELTLTPAQTEGPYYPDRLPLDQDNDLLIINDNITPAVGTIAWISGRVLDRRGSPIRGALVEIWQADNGGNYIHSQGVTQGGVRDGNFQGYGRFVTGSSGEYLFRTIKPGLYPGRVRHVHYKITLPGGTVLITQLYIEGETGNDGVLNAIPAAQRSAVIRPWRPIPYSSVGALATTFDIVMNYTPADTPAPSRPTIVSMAGIVNAATLYAGAAAGSWVTVFGDSLAATTRTWRESDFAGDNLPQSLDGVSVEINNRPAFVHYVSPKQLNVLAPSDLAPGQAQVTVRNANGVSDPVSVEVRSLMPGFFSIGQEYVAAVRADGTYVGPPELLENVSLSPAQPGEQVVLFGTGFGPTQPAPAEGRNFQGAYPLANAVRLWIDTTQVDVSFAGLISPGLYQFNLTVPQLADGDYPVTAEVSGVRTSKIARIRIQRQAGSALRRPPSSAVAAQSPAQLYAQLMNDVRGSAQPRSGALGEHKA